MVMADFADVGAAMLKVGSKKGEGGKGKVTDVDSESNRRSLVIVPGALCTFFSLFS